MGDDAPLGLTVYDCPDDERDAVLGIINEHELALDYEGYGREEEELILGRTYGDGQASLGRDDEIGIQLMSEAPNATWRLHQDGVYGNEAQVQMYVPELGLFKHSADNNEWAVFRADEVRELLAMSAEERDNKLGTPWEKRIDELRTALALT